MTVNFDKPGPGNWELDTAHFDADVSRVVIDLIEYAVPVGIGQVAALAGAPFKTMEAAFVHGRFYRRIVPLVGGDRDLATPPAPILWLATRLHPAFRKRERVAANAMERRVWLDELDRWETEWKPDLIAFNRSMGAVDLDSLSDDELASHVDTVHARIRESVVLHFRLHGSDMGPIGRLLVHGRDLGFDDADVMSCLSGHSPSTSAPAVALNELRRLVSATNAAPNTLDEVRALSPEIAGALDAYLAEFGPRLTTGYDVTESTLAEMPELVLTMVLAPPVDDAHDEAVRALGEETADRLLGQVPPDRRDEFAMILNDARLLYGLRDENGPITYEWPGGLLRLAMLASARRLVGRGALPSDDHVFDLSADELAALLRGASTPSPEEIRERHRTRKARLDYEAPTWLGTAEEPPPTWVLPTTMAEQARVTFALLELLESESTEALCGVGVGAEPYIGTARVVRSAEDAVNNVAPGDIVVAPFTAPTYNAILSMAGAVVVEQGGLLCHTAVIARELGIPAIVGASQAMARIPDGATVEVDPVKGRVRVVETAGSAG